MKKEQPLSHQEKLYRENEEYNKKNQDEVKIKVDKAAKFRKENGYSLTMSKLMAKYGCKTVEEYRIVRKENKAKLKKAPKAPKAAPVPVNDQQQKRKK